MRLSPAQRATASCCVLEGLAAHCSSARKLKQLVCATSPCHHVSCSMRDPSPAGIPGILGDALCVLKQQLSSSKVTPGRPILGGASEEPARKLYRYRYVRQEMSYCCRGVPRKMHR